MKRPKPIPRVRLERRETGGYRVIVCGPQQYIEAGTVYRATGGGWAFRRFNDFNNLVGRFLARRDAVAALVRGARVR